MTRAQDTLAGWLALHGLTADQCRPLLQRLPPPDLLTPPDPALPTPPDAVWASIAAQLTEAMPAGADAIARTHGLTRLHRQSATAVGPRALTLHDDGTGRPVVSVRLTGRLSDHLVLAHEFGHACQIVASGTGLPPALREVCANLAEHLVLATIFRSDPPQATMLAALFAARGWRQREKARQGLLVALSQPATLYDHSWNYPIARQIAADLARRPDHQIWPVFLGQRRLAALLP